MKLISPLLLLLVLDISMAFGQRPFWVVESNKYIKNLTIVRIYDGNSNLIAEQKLSRSVDIRRPEEVWMLNRMVKSVVRGKKAHVPGRWRRNMRTTRASALSGTPV